MKFYQAVIIICIAMLTGFISNASSENSAEIMVEGAQGGPIYENILLEIKSNGIIILIEDNAYYNIETGKIHLDKNAKIKKYHVKLWDAMRMKQLMQRIGNGEADKVNPVSDITDVFATINGKIYWASFADYGNKELLELTNIILKAIGGCQGGRCQGGQHYVCWCNI